MTAATTTLEHPPVWIPSNLKLFMTPTWLAGKAIPQISQQVVSLQLYWFLCYSVTYWDSCAELSSMLQARSLTINLEIRGKNV